jgi:hypothetical protein
MHSVMYRVRPASLLVLLCFAAHPAFACTRGASPIFQHDPSEYVFIGEVAGYIGPFDTGAGAKTGWALRVMPRAKVYMPREPRQYFEIVAYRTYSDCSTEPVAADELAHRFPIGMFIDVVGHTATEYQREVSDGAIRLEIAAELITEASGIDTPSSVTKVCDYREYRGPNFGRAEAGGCGHAAMWELRKDLLRLQLAQDEQEREAIVERLAYYPSVWDDLDYEKVVARNVRDRAVARRLKEVRKRFEQELLRAR